MKRFALVCLLPAFATLIATAAVADPVTVVPYPPGKQDLATLNAGIPNAELAYHPTDNSSYGESWQSIAFNENGDQVWALLSVSNYNPFNKLSGTIDLFYYPADGETVTGHEEIKSKSVEGATDRMRIRLDDSVVEGDPPTFRIKASAGKIDVDLTFESCTPGYVLGQQYIQFKTDGDPYWTLGVASPRAKASGTVRVNGKEMQFAGMGYFDHGRSTIKIPSFTSKWYLLRVFDESGHLGVIQFHLKDGYQPNRVNAIHATEGDQVILNSGAVTLTAEGETKDEESGLSIPKAFHIAYDDGTTKVEGTMTVTRLIDRLEVLAMFSPMVRTVIKTFYTDPWQFRLGGEVDIAITRNGQTRKMGKAATAMAEVRYFQ